MKKLELISIVIWVLLLCGCTGYREINRGYLVTAIGFEQEQDNTKIFIEAMSSKDNADKTNERVVLSAVGNSPESAFDNLNTTLTKPLYFEQLGTIILDENTDIQQHRNMIAFFEKIDQLSLGVYVVKSSDVKSLFDAQTPDGVLGYDIIGLINNYKNQTGQALSNQIFHLQRSEQTLPIIDIADEKLNIIVLGEEK